jgi:outer membrane receptor for ferric coprogen and ferric-rhodotorulic acid
MRQYISLISNTAAVTPIDIWKTSNKYIRPQTGDQVIIGYFKNFADNSIETSIEAYYKKTDNLLEYKDGAVLLLNETLEADLLEGRGRAYGLEFQVNKKSGRLTGWTSYAYSRSERQVDGEFPEEQINFGKFYPSNYDKPHNVKIVSNYRITQRWSFAANFVYSTGRPFTAPYSKYRIMNGPVTNITVANFSQRNQYRIPDYHRLDISVTLGAGHRRNRKWKGSWTFSVYNVYGRRNPYSVFFKHIYGTPPMPYKLSILGVPFPSLTYNFIF